jgi:PPOX class probable F420-dependent enzyme
MDLDEARQIVREQHRAVLATPRSDGRSQLSPVMVGVDPEGCVVISSREAAYKVRNLRRDPRASVCVFSDPVFGRWAQLDGTAEIVSLPQAMEPLVEYYRSLSGEHPDWDEYRQAMEEQKRVLIRIHLERAGPDRAG